MRYHSHINRGIAVLLLLIFFQQTGAVLFIHNLVHDKKSVTENPVKKDGKASEVSYSCNCIDHFLLPYVEPDEITAIQRPARYANYADGYIRQTYLTDLIYFSRRGPPAFHG
ncbi:MAG: hypothetical protein ACSLE0_01880 [Chitinophagaceae bacterium]